MDLRPRAVGQRISFRGVHPSVRSWLAGRFGQTEVVSEHVGGMSPGCATSLETRSGARIFVKAVGAELNPDTPNLFRSEISVLSHLPSAPYRPRLLDSFDNGTWVAIVLEDIDGRVPDLSDPAGFAAVATVVHRQASELTPVPPGMEVPTVESAVQRWIARWEELASDPARVLPVWARERCTELHSRVRSLAGRLDATTLCHFDLRDDNLLLRTDGQVFVLDWGIARAGPAWLDKALFALQAADAKLADQSLRDWISTDEQDVVTTLIVAFAGSQAWNSTRTPPPALPTLPAFCRDDAQRAFAVARLRL